jgi:Holliday junction DNA helicase RuvB
MEDFRVDIVVGKGPGATAIPLQLPHFTLVGATTRAGLLPSPLRDRFGFTAHLDFYQESELERVLVRSAKLLGVTIDTKAVSEIARRSRGTPRIANNLLRRTRDFAQVKGSGIIDVEIAQIALNALDVDQNGLDEMDNRILMTIIEKFKGGPVGLTTIATACGEEAETIEEVYEPYLIQEGDLVRTARGREATDLAYRHQGKIPPTSTGKLF